MKPANGKGCDMASSAEYLEYVLDLLADVPEVTTRKMMGEYLLYAQGRLFGGIYDDRFLVKPTPASRVALATEEVPYEGAAPMLLVDIEDGAVCRYSVNVSVAQSHKGQSVIEGGRFPSLDGGPEPQGMCRERKQRAARFVKKIPERAIFRGIDQTI